MKKRTIALWTLVAVWSAIAFAVDFNRDGGWTRIFYDIDVITAPVDTVLRVDTVKITNAQNDTIRLDFPEFASFPSAYGQMVLKFNASNNDTSRWFTADVADTVADTIDLVLDLSFATANNDSAIIYWYSNIIKLDTVIQTRKDIPIFAKNALLTRTWWLSNLDSTGVTFVVQTRVGDSGTWATVATTGMMTETDSSQAFADTLSKSYLFWGDQIRTLRIFVDSVGGTVRRTSLGTEVYWRGLR